MNTAWTIPTTIIAILDAWISTGSSTYAFPNNLVASVPYYWQVRARNLVDTTDAGGGWWSFTSNGIPALRIYLPLILSPGN